MAATFRHHGNTTPDDPGNRECMAERVAWLNVREAYEALAETPLANEQRCEAMRQRVHWAVEAWRFAFYRRHTRTEVRAA